MERSVQKGFDRADMVRDLRLGGHVQRVRRSHVYCGVEREMMEWAPERELPEAGCQMRNRMELRSRMSLPMTLAIALVFAGLGRAGQANMTPLAAKPGGKGSLTESQKPVTELKGEVFNQDVPTIKSRVNLVQVKVLVRNEKGESVADLQREDFRVYDDGKLQMISTFGVETPETFRKREEAAAKTEKVESSPETAREGIPQRYVAVVFDDVHMQTTDILPVRAGSEKLMDSLKPSDRIGIFSTSGQMIEEFTSDKEALKCAFHNQNRMAMAAKSMAESLLKQQLTAGNADNEASYRRMEEVLREMSKRPGERIVILVSPGFLLASLYSDEMGMIERANRAGVVINTLDSRGLFSPAADDISKPVSDTMSARNYKANYRLAAQFDADSVLRDFAQSTGGTFFHNSNDLAGGMQQLGAAPEVSYLLGYSPQDQKMDGKYHL